MAFLRNAWYVIGFPAEFSEKPVRRQICGDWLALFRGADGAMCVIEDRCPHRFVPLSMGEVEGTQIRCGYHGLAFDGHTGACTDRPMEDGPVNPKLCVKTYPVEERHGLVWGWMGAKERADASLIPDFSLLVDPSIKNVPGYLHMKANNELIVDNLLDLSHVQFLHKQIAGQGDVSAFQHRVEQEGNRVWSHLYRPNITPAAFQRDMWGSSSPLADSYAICRWDAPGVILVYTSIQEVGQPADTGLRIPSAHLLTPETEFSSHYFWTSGRNAKQDDATLDKFLHDTVDTIFTTQDGPMIEAQQAAMGETTDFLSQNPVILKPDGAGIRARRVMHKLRRAEQQEYEPASIAAE